MCLLQRSSDNGLSESLDPRHRVATLLLEQPVMGLGHKTLWLRVAHMLFFGGSLITVFIGLCDDMGFCINILVRQVGYCHIELNSLFMEKKDI